MNAKASKAVAPGLPAGRPQPCTCGRIAVGMATDVARDWHRDCPAHGTRSAWYRNFGKAYFAAYAQYTRELQRLARIARATGVAQVLPEPPQHQDLPS